MKKKLIIGLITIGIVAISVVLLLVFKNSQEPNYKMEVKLEATVLDNDGGSLTIWYASKWESGLCFVSMPSPPRTPIKLIGENGKSVEADYLLPGRLVEITYTGGMQLSDPPSIMGASKIKVLGQADAAIYQNALEVYTEYRAVDVAVYAVSNDGSGLERIQMRIGPTPEELFEEWKMANNAPADIKLNRYFEQNNGFEERSTSDDNGTVSYVVGDTLEIEMDLSAEFLDYLTSATDEKLLISSLANTIIGDEPYYPNTFLILTVDGNQIVTKNNDFRSPIQK